MNSVFNNRAVLVFSFLTIASLGAPAWAEDMPFDVANLGRSLLSNGGAMPLPVVSTGSVDINSVDMPFLRSNGGQGAFSLSTIKDFWRGAYGFAGDAAQQEALMREGEWLRQNGQI